MKEESEKELAKKEPLGKDKNHVEPVENPKKAASTAKTPKT